MVVCELFSFVQECDMPNWFAMLIELSIGGTIAILFFLRQNKQSNKIQSILDNEQLQALKRYERTLMFFKLYINVLNHDLQEIKKTDKKQFRKTRRFVISKYNGKLKHETMDELFDIGFMIKSKIKQFDRILIRLENSNFIGFVDFLDVLLDKLVAYHEYVKDESKDVDHFGYTYDTLKSHMKYIFDRYPLLEEESEIKLEMLKTLY